MGKSIRQVVTFAATPHDVYELLMSSEKHAAFSGSAASISREAGGPIMAYDGYITGKNIELVPDRRIVQTWRASDWPDGIVSIVTFDFSMVKGRTEMVFTQTGVPDDQVAQIRKGWIDFYWQPMREAIGSKPGGKRSGKRRAAGTRKKTKKRGAGAKGRTRATVRKRN
jgi:activator of HSP90 ATPase